MSLTSAHQIAFRALADALETTARAASPGAAEIFSGLSLALHDAADELQARDTAKAEPFDRRRSTITYDPKAKSK